MKSMYLRISIFAVMLCICCPNVVFASDTHDGIPLPSGTLGTVFYYDQTTGNKLYSDGDKLSDDFNISSDVGIWRAVYYYEIGGMTTATNLLVPFGSVSVDGAAVGNTNTSASGMADPVLNQAIWLVNKPDQLSWATFSTFVTVPCGQYDNDKLVNLGSNRWAIKPEFSMTRGIGTKGTFLEMLVNGEFYTKNDEYGAGKVDLKQDTLYTFETHLVQHLAPETFVSLDYFYHTGGETKVAGVKQDNKHKDHALQFTLAHMITEKTQLMLKYKSDLKVNNGPKTNTFGLRVAYLLPPFK